MADIKLNKPEAGANQTVPAEDGARFVLDFASDAASIAREGDNLEINFSDGSQINIENFYTQYNAENLPEFEVEGQPVSADEFFASMNEPDLSPAAGGATAAAAATGGRYRDYTNAALGTGLDHLDRLDYNSDRGFEFEDGDFITGPDLDLLATGAIDHPVTIIPDNPWYSDVNIPIIPSGSNDPFNPDGANLDLTAPMSAVRVFEKNIGTNDALARESFTINAPDGVGTIAIGNKVIFENGRLVPESDRTFHTDEGELIITDFDPQTGRLDYSFKITEATDEHTKPGDDSISHVFKVTVTDTDGDTASSYINVIVVDDIPEAVDDRGHVEAGETVSDSVLVNDDHGADGQGKFGDGAIVRWDVPENATPIENGYVIEYPNEGVLTIYNDGNYSFVSDPDADTGVLPSLSYTIIDTDGDTSKAQLVIDINNKPIIGKDPDPKDPGDDPDPVDPKLNVSEVTVKENTLSGGSDEGGEGKTATGSFEVDTYTEGGTLVLSFGDKPPVTIILDKNDSGDIDPASNTIETEYGTFTVTSVVKGQVNYTYTLTRPFGHEDDPAEPGNTAASAEKINITLTDNVGHDKASGTIGVNIVDDVPQAAPDFDYLVEGDKMVATGNVIAGSSIMADPNAGHDYFGADRERDIKKLEWSNKLPDNSPYTLKDDGKVFYNDDEIGTLLLDSDGTYTFTLDEGYDVPPNGLPDFKIDYTIYDKDGDSSSTTLTIKISGDDLPDNETNKPYEPGEVDPFAPDRIVDVDEGLLKKNDIQENDGSGKYHKATDDNGAKPAHPLEGDQSFSAKLDGDGTIEIRLPGHSDAALEVTINDGIADWKPETTFAVNGVEFSGFNVEKDGGGNWKVSYHYTLTSNVAHKEADNVGDNDAPGINDTLGASLVIVVKDGETGGQSVGSIVVNVHDDVPVFSEPTGEGKVEYNAPDYFKYDFTNFDTSAFKQIMYQQTNGGVNWGEGKENGNAYSYLKGNQTDIKFDMTASVMHYQYSINNGQLSVEYVNDISNIIDNTAKAFDFDKDEGVSMGHNGLGKGNAPDANNNTTATPWNEPGEFGTGTRYQGNKELGTDYTGRGDNGGQTQMLQNSYGNSITESNLWSGNVAEGIVFDLYDIAYGIKLNLGSWGKDDRLVLTFLSTPPNSNDNQIIEIKEINFSDYTDGYIDYHVESGFTKVFVSALGSGKYDLDDNGLKATLVGDTETSGFTIKNVEFTTPKWTYNGEISANSADGITGYEFAESVFPSTVAVKGKYAGYYNLEISHTEPDTNGWVTWTGTIKDGPVFSNEEGKENLWNNTTLFTLKLNTKTGKYEFEQMREFTTNSGNPIFVITATDGDGDQASYGLSLTGEFVRFDEMQQGTYNGEQVTDLTKDIHDDVLIGYNGNSLMYGKGGDDLIFGDAKNDMSNTDDNDVDAVIKQINSFKQNSNQGATGLNGLLTNLGNLSADQLEKLAAKFEEMEGKDFFGKDLIYGGTGNDVLLGMGGDDILHGQEGNDYLFGGSGDDQLFGGSGNDVLAGGSGNDFLDGGAGNNTLLGGSGDDIIVYGANGINDIIDGGEGIDILLVNDDEATLDTIVDGDKVKNIEILVKNSSMDDEEFKAITSLAKLGILIEGESLYLTSAWGVGTNLDNNIVEYVNMTSGLTIQIKTGGKLNSENIHSGMQPNEDGSVNLVAPQSDTEPDNDGGSAGYGLRGVEDLDGSEHDLAFGETSKEINAPEDHGMQGRSTSFRLARNTQPSSDKDNGEDSQGGEEIISLTDHNVEHGTDGNDLLFGGDENDVIFAEAGDDLIIFDDSDYLIDGGSGLDIILAENTNKTLGEMIDNYINRGTDDFDKDTPMVNDVEVMIKGLNLDDIKSYSDLSKFGIQIGDNQLSLDKSKGWEESDINTFTNGKGITIETTNLTDISSISSETGNIEMITLQMNVQTDSGSPC